MTNEYAIIKKARDLVIYSTLPSTCDMDHESIIAGRAGLAVWMLKQLMVDFSEEGKKEAQKTIDRWEN